MTEFCIGGNISISKFLLSGLENLQKVNKQLKEFSPDSSCIRLDNKNLKFSHYAVSLIAVVIILLNFYVVKASNNDFESDLSALELNPEQTLEIIISVANYTSIIDEDVNDLNSKIVADEGGYLAKNNSVITEASKLETEYLVQKGDTLSGIANKFNLHVASITDRNGMGVNDLENLQPGQKLIIPSKDTSSSQDWLAQLNQKKANDRKVAAQKAQTQKAKLAAANRSTVSRERSDSGYDGEDTGGWIVPTSYQYISRGIQRGHQGIDMVENTGTAVYAAKAGRVIEITRNWGSGYGNSVVVDHGGGQTSRYAHLSGFEVGTGDYVGQGQLIGESGNTGWSTGPHLHFEARINGKAFNPFK